MSWREAAPYVTGAWRIPTLPVRSPPEASWITKWSSSATGSSRGRRSGVAYFGMTFLEAVAVTKVLNVFSSLIGPTEHNRRDLTIDDIA
jgi:hypothetical protein